MNYSLNKLYSTIGISKQAVHKYERRQVAFDTNLMQLTAEADELRADHPGCGVEKMYDILQPGFIGRDRFVEHMMQLGYRLKRKRNYRRTTIAGNKFYPNLIKGMKVSAPSTIWQSDITYIRIGEKHYYAVFILDVYTKKIVGYSVTDHMRATANIRALRMALAEHPPPRIHHSDRGSQYTYSGYLRLLKDNNVQISMCKSGQDNAYAERINRTIKEEYLEYWKPKSLQQLKAMIKKAIENYNNIRKHNHLPKMSPVEFEHHLNTEPADQRMQVTIYDDRELPDRVSNSPTTMGQ